MAIKNNYILIILTSILIIVAGLLNKEFKVPSIKVSKQDSALNVNNQFLRIFDIGQNRLFSDFLWITTLLESDMEHYKGSNLNSWMFVRFNTIATMDPKFIRNYQFGGQYLSIIKDDLIGAEKLMLKGLEYFPNDYKLNFSLGYLYSIEMDQYKKAIPYLEKILTNDKAPKNLKSFITKIKYMASHDLEETYNLLISLLDTTEDPIVKKKVQGDLYAIKAELDLNCLNSNKNENCSQEDYDGNSYVRISGKYYSQKKFKKYKLHKRAKVSQ